MSIIAGFIVPHPPLIVPEVGRGKEAAIQKTIDSCHAVARQIGNIRPQTIIVISPHSVMYEDYIHISPGAKAEGILKNFGAAAVFHAEYDVPLVGEITRLCGDCSFPAGTLGEKNKSLDHGTLIPLYFINQYFTDYRLVRCSVSGLSLQEHYRFGMLLRQSAEALNREAVIVASGDLSHKLTYDGPYGFATEGPELDQKLVNIMKSGLFGDFFALDDSLREKAAECGLNSFVTMSGVFDSRSVDAMFYSYEGPFGVGYAVCEFMDKGADKNRDFLTQEIKNNQLRMQTLRDKEDIYVRIARETLESYVNTGSVPPMPENLPDDLRNKRAGVFVSIKKHGRLRGCIGTTEPTTQSIADEIRQNAVSSGLRDPRFAPVTPDELPGLVYSVDVLSPSSPCKRTDLDVKQYGVIVSNGHKRGLLLPNLDGVDTVDEQISIACQKAGIGTNEKYTLERFEVTRHT